MLSHTQRPPLIAEPVSTVDSIGESGPPSQGARDLVLVILIALLAWILTGAPTLLRVPVGVVAALFTPGYALIALLFPRRDDLDTAERIGLGLAASFAVLTVEALVLDRLPGGLQPDAMRAIVVASTFVLAVMAAVRRRRAPGQAPAQPAVPGRRPAVSRALRFTQAIVVVNVVAAALAYALTIGGQPPKPTEFFVLGNTDQLSDYPREVVLGQPFSVHAGINQTPARAGSYTVTAKRDDKVLASVGPISLNAGAQWSSYVTIPTDTVGDDQEILLLLEDGSTAPVRTLRLWINVRAPEPGAG